MIPYEELVLALDELNGKIPARQRPPQPGPRERVVSAPAQQAVAESWDEPAEEDEWPSFVEEAPLTMEPLAATMEPEEDPYDDFPAAPEPAPELMSEPLPEPMPEPMPEMGMEENFEILAEESLPLPPAEPVEGAGFDVLGDQAFSGFFEEPSSQAQDGAPVGNEDLYDLPTPPPVDEELPPPPPPGDWN